MLHFLYIKGDYLMTNSQIRLLSTAIALLAGAVLATTSNIDVNVSIAIILISSALFIVEYFRNQKT
jgi:hypothetical protein